MTSKLIIAFLASLFLGGCGVTVVPKPTASAVLNPTDNSLTEDKAGVIISARVQDLEVAPYRMVDNVTSFYVTVNNKTGREVSIPLESFLLIDDEGNQFRPIEPGKIQGIVSRDSSYLIPYPYVGYYYLEDKEKSAFFNTFESALPFYAENYPQDIFTQALPAGAVIPGAKISGLVYFVIDLHLKKGVQLGVYLPDSPKTAHPDYVFPFSIEKK